MRAWRPVVVITGTVLEKGSGSIHNVVPQSYSKFGRLCRRPGLLLVKYLSLEHSPQILWDEVEIFAKYINTFIVMTKRDQSY